MLKMVRNVVLGAVAVMAASAPAQALLLNASYTLESGDVVTMVFDGTVQGDGDTIVINSMFAPKFNGVTPGHGPFRGFQSMSDAFGGGQFGDPIVVPASVSLSGVNMDIVYFNDYPNDGPNDGFLIETLGIFGGPGTAAYSDGGSFGGGTGEAFDSQRWSVAEAPVPAALPLLAAGIGALGIAGYRRRA